ncbi:MAG TPA: dipeptidase PepV [Feifaniaceae bacterium]|nr:dipeptidase PepV [Feifaniaceae bacterium]
MAFFSSISTERQERLVSFIAETLDRQVQDLQALVRIPSVKGAPEGKLPFGAPIQQALDFTLKLGEKLGFPGGRDIDGYAGYIETGAGEEMLGILTHLDVVPAGDGWTTEPFGGAIRDGRVYGRGAIDDKGPTVSALYALAAIQAADIPLKKRVRVILGCDEESGWACMTRYKQTEELPTIAFSPDGEYPLVYSEKAILQVSFKKKLRHKTVLKASAGERPNVVPGIAEATAPISVGVPGFHTADGFSLATTAGEDGTRLIVTGLGAHASTPESGRNALLYLLKLLRTLDLPKEDASLVRFLADMLKMDLHGETLGLDTEDDSGRLTFNAGVLRWDEQEVSVTFDVRCPHSLPAEEALGRLKEALAPAGFEADHTRIQQGLLVPRDSELVQKLMGVYRAQTGDTKREPLAIGGGTYARAMTNAVAFGAEWPGDPMLAHMPDEYISIDDLRRNTLMLADAILALAME